MKSVLLGSLIAFSYGQTALAAPITFNTALPISDEGVLIRQQIIYDSASDDINGVSRQISTLRSMTAIGYGITDRLAVFGVVPVIKRNAEIGGFKSEASGLADIRLFARYQIYRKDQPGKTLRIAPFLGAILPTGKTGETSDGSTDFFGGLILTRASTAWNFDGQLRYTVNGKKNGFERGNEARIDGSVQYRMDSFNENVNVSGYLFTVLDAGIVYQDENKILGTLNRNSGGTTAFIAPGLQYRTTRWIGETALRIPVVKDLNGTALQPGLTVITSVRFNF